jgi:hypothetical protein
MVPSWSLEPASVYLSKIKKSQKTGFAVYAQANTEFSMSL